jgi:hypothetical protein
MAKRSELSVQNSYQIEVELGGLREVSKEFRRLLEERLKTDVEINGDKLMLRERHSEHLRTKDVKIATKHVLHHLGFSHSYRVLSEHNVIRIVRVEEKRRHVEKESIPPAPSQSLPYLFPT